jgi:hypothetical protein
MQDEVRVAVAAVRVGVGAAASEFARFRGSGDPAKGEFHCVVCSYGVIVHSTLPVCPMCGGGEWEHTSWSPLTRVRRTVLQ